MLCDDRVPLAIGAEGALRVQGGSQVCSVSLSSLSLSQGLLSAKVTRPLMAGSWLGLRVLALQPWGLSANSPLETGKLSLRRGGLKGPHSPHTLDPGGGPV